MSKAFTYIQYNVKKRNEYTFVFIDGRKLVCLRRGVASMVKNEGA